MTARSLWSRNFILINLCSVFASFTNFAYIYILPVHMLRIGGSNTDVGLMGAGMTILGLLTRFVFSPLIDRIGRKPMLMAGVSLFTLNAFGFFLLRSSVPGILLMRCMSGFSQGIFFPVPPTCISDVSPKEKLVDALGVFGISSSLPAIFSPLLGLYLYDHVSPAAFFTVTALVPLLSCIAALLYKDEYKPEPVSAGTRQPFRISTVVETSVLLPCLLFFFACFGFSAVNNFVLTFGESRHIAGMSLFFTVHNLAIVATRLIAGRLRAKLAVKRIITLGTIIAGVGIFMIAFAHGLVMMLAASVVIAFGGTIYSQYLQADVLLRVSEKRRGVANSSLMLFQDVGQGAGAATFGLTSEHLGYPWTFASAGIIAILSVLFHVRDQKKER